MSSIQFTSQASWTTNNIRAVLRAIESGQIKSESALRRIIGDQSKKKYADGEFTVGSKILGLKIASMKDINTAEHHFYAQYTDQLKGLEKESSHKGLLNIKENDAYSQYKADHPNSGVFMKNVYDFTMGRFLAEKGIEMMTEKIKEKENRNIDRNEASRLLLEELRKIAELRGEENKLFDALSKKVSSQFQKDAIQAHKKAEERELSSITQITEYLENPEKINILIKDAKNYQKYLKYKAKYLALKKQLEQKN